MNCLPNPAMTHPVFIALCLLLSVHCLPVTAQTLDAGEVTTIVNQAATAAAALNPPQDALISVVDREGNVLVVWDTIPGTVPTPEEVGDVISRAGVACFLNSNQNALTSRTAGFIVQANFPPGFTNRINGPLIGVNFSHFSWSDINRFRAPPFPAVPANPAVSPALGAAIPNTSLSGTPGGVPLYENGVLVGGVAVIGDNNDEVTPGSIASADTDESLALAGQIGFEPPVAIRAFRIFFDGISLPYVKSSVPSLGAVGPVGAPAVGFGFPITASPLPAGYPNVPIYPTDTFSGVTGELRAPIIDAANPGGLTSPLTAGDVRNIMTACVARANITRSRIRIPRGSAAAVYVAVVAKQTSDPAQAGQNTPGQVLGIFRMPDTVSRSWDISVQKARTCTFFSNSDSAFTTRAVGWLSQEFYPPGINNPITPSGPWFAIQPGISNINSLVPVNANFPNGITIFAGGHPLYKDGQCVGAVGISGDGIDEDDIIAAAGTVAPRADGQGTFAAPDGIRADKFTFRGARLPYAKFPRNPVR
ncbi:MAG: heme-binding protein [Verrucomicrobiota bacterium]